MNAAISRSLTPLFGLIVRSRNALYDRRIIPTQRLLGPVISVGNLSVGGAGKTPFVILLGEWLKQRGIAFDVLSRGYGRQTRGVKFVDPAGSAAEFGDEPLLIARRLAVPVIVGEDRYQAGLAAESRFGAELHILDDGFQHRSLARDLDIVLVTPDDAAGGLLPFGRLREPLSSLSRADVVVLASGAGEGSFPLQGKEVWRVRRGIVPRDFPSQPVVFCGIARPKNFFYQLRAVGVAPVAEAVFRDHYQYQPRDVSDLRAMGEQNGADGFITTQKDEINLGPLAQQLEPLAVVEVKMQLVDSEKAQQTILRVLEKRNHAA